MDAFFATDFLIRLCQVLFVALIGAFAGLVTWNNVTDPRSNLLFVQHLMSMDTTFEQSTLRRRAITNPALHKLFFGVIVAVEGLTALLCLLGAAWLGMSLTAGVAEFHAAKALAFCGLALGFALWFGGFMVVGGQWFASWQSERWNGRESAFMFYTAIGFVFLVLLVKA